MAFGTRRNLATRTVVFGTLCAIACCNSGQSRFVQAALAQSTDGTTPTQLTSNQIEGEAEASGQSYYYTFTGGPGDLTIKLDGETDFYSTNAHVVLHDERGVELGKVALNATGNSASKSATIHLTKSQVIKMQIMLGVNVGIHLKYKVSLAGPLNLQAYPTRLASRQSNLQLASVNVAPAQSSRRLARRPDLGRDLGPARTLALNQSLISTPTPFPFRILALTLAMTPTQALTLLRAMPQLKISGPLSSA